jgi:hypothetical protein
MTLVGSSAAYTGVILPTPAAGDTKLTSTICITCTLDVADYTSSNIDLAVYSIATGTFSVTTLSSNKDACYNKFL